MEFVEVNFAAGLEHDVQHSQFAEHRDRADLIKRDTPGPEHDPVPEKLHFRVLLQEFLALVEMDAGKPDRIRIHRFFQILRKIESPDIVRLRVVPVRQEAVRKMKTVAFDLLCRQIRRRAAAFFAGELRPVAFERAQAAERTDVHGPFEILRRPL